MELAQDEALLEDRKETESERLRSGEICTCFSTTLIAAYLNAWLPSVKFSFPYVAIKRLHVASHSQYATIFLTTVEISANNFGFWLLCVYYCIIMTISFGFYKYMYSYELLVRCLDLRLILALATRLKP